MATTIPVRIINKVKQIHDCQEKVKDLINEIEKAYPELLEKEDSVNGWLWSQHIDMQGAVGTTLTYLSWLQRYLDSNNPVIDSN
jgi:hypothetical protein